MMRMQYICPIAFDTRNLGNIKSSEAVRLLNYAIDNGIDYFDVSSHFMKGKSEKIFLEAMSHIGKDIHVSYKYGRIPSENDTKDIFCKYFFDALKRFGRSYFDIYTIFDINSFERWEEYFKNGFVYESALKLKEKGFIKKIGITFRQHEGNELAKVLDICPGIDVVFMPVSPLNRSYGERAVQVCKSQGIELCLVTPLLGGVIEKYPEIIEPIMIQGLSAGESAIRYLSELRAPLFCSFISESQIAKVLRVISDSFSKPVIYDFVKEYEVFCTGCGLCTMCPIKSNVVTLMAAYNSYIVSGNPEDMVMYIKAAFGDEEYLYQSRKCIGCRLCEQICPQGINISERIERIRDEAHKT